MAPTKPDPNSVVYTQLPTNNHNDPPPPPYVIVLPNYHRPSTTLRRCLLLTSGALLLCLAVFLFYPSDPKLQLSRLKLNHVKINSSKIPISLDLSFNLTLKVRNRDLYSLDYQSLDIAIGYRGKELGVVKSRGGFVRAKASSYVEATVELKGLEIVHDVLYLLEDLARGVIPFDTVSKVEGKLRLFFFQLPIKAKVSCDVLVSTKNQTVIHQDCYE